MFDNSHNRIVAGLMVCVLFTGCDTYEPDWGNQKLHAAISALSPSDIRAATVELDVSPREPHAFAPEHIPETLERVRRLQSAPDIGLVGPWDGWVILRIDAGGKGKFKLEIATRESLAGKPIVILREDTPGGGIGFYDGEAFWNWFARLPEVEALGFPPEGANGY